MKKNNMLKTIALIISLVLIISAFAIGSISISANEITTNIEYDESQATYFVFNDSEITVSEGSYKGYKIEGTSLSIKESGTYIISGSCSNGSIVIKKNVTGVILVLDGLTLSSSATAPITCNKGSEVTIIAAEGSVNNLADDEYNNDDIYTDEELYPDIENAVIKCKDGSNVTICGTGTINITANGKNGIKGGYDLYEEDADGNATDNLISTASLTINNLTLNIVANVNDGLKSDKELNILSGVITITAVDDGIKSDYVLNIGEERTEGPTITIVNSTEGIEAATLNVYSGNITVNATDDGINAANSDLSGYDFSYNQYGGYVYINVTNGDGIDSNGTINLIGGTLEVYSPAQGDGDPLDSENGTFFKGTTVLAVGHLGMQQSYSATTPYVVFGNTSSGMMGGMMSMGSNQSNLVTAGSTIQITDKEGNVIYTAKAVRNAGYILFSSTLLENDSTYTLVNNSTTVSTSTASTTGTDSQMPWNGQDNQGMFPNGNGEQNQFSGHNFGQFGGRQNGGFPGMNPFGGEMPNMPEMNGETPPEFPNDGNSQFPGMPNGDMPDPPEMNGNNPFDGENDPWNQLPENNDNTDNSDNTEIDDTESEQNDSNWFEKIIKVVIDFLKSLFGF